MSEGKNPETDEQAAAELRKLALSKRAGPPSESEFDPEWVRHPTRQPAGAPARNHNGCLSLISFLIPLAGIILGCLFLAKDAEEDKKTGWICMVCALIGLVWGAVLIALLRWGF